MFKISFNHAQHDICMLFLYRASICKGVLGSRNSVRPSVNPSVCPSVRLSVCLSVTWPTFIILEPPRYLWNEATDLKFSVRIELKARKPTNAKVGQKGRGLRHVTYFLNFGPPSMEWVQLETSNSVCGSIDRRAYKPKMQKYVKRVSRRSRDLLFSDLESVERHSLRSSHN